MRPLSPHKNVYTDGRRLYTVNAVPGVAVYGERLCREQGVEYREWDAMRSKLAAALLKHINVQLFPQDAIILYLGASTGTTVSHLSDLLDNGFIYAVEFAPTVLRELVFVAQDRTNIAPILADANHPDEYGDVPNVDIIYMDIAQKNQVDIFLKNLQFLKKGGIAYLAVKARSIDVGKDPRVIFRQVRAQLEKAGTILDAKELDPFQKDHAFFVLKR